MHLVYEFDQGEIVSSILEQVSAYLDSISNNWVLGKDSGFLLLEKRWVYAFLKAIDMNLKENI